VNIDAEAIKERSNCQDVISRDLGAPVTTSGGAWQWYCCFHDDRSGGSPSLTAWEDGWKCFSGACGAHGDVIGWVMKRQNVDFRRACEILTDGRLDDFATDAPRPERKPVPLRRPAGVTWQQSAKQFVLQSQETLWGPAGARARTYLQNERGLSEHTMRTWGLGFNATERWDSLDKWPEAQAGKRKKVWLPRAIVIPHWQQSLDMVWSIKFRLPAVEKNAPRYINIPGGQYDLYGADQMQQRERAILCEGEFDTMLLWETVGDVADVLTFGSASIRDTSDWMPYLMSIKQLYVALDNDEAGEKAAQEWLAFTERARRAAPPAGHKDLTDAWRGGVDLRSWAMNTMSLNDPRERITVEWPADTPMPVVVGQWQRTEEGKIVATYERDVLELVVEAMQ